MAAKQLKTGLPRSAGGSPAHTPKLPIDPQVVEALQEVIKESMKDYIKETIKETIKESVKESIKEELKASLKEELQSLNVAMEGKFQEMAEEISGIKEVMDDQNNKIREDIILAFKCLATNAVQMEEKMEEINVNLGNKIEEMQTKVDKADDELVLIQYRSMEFALRVRGLKECNREDLKEIFSEAFAQEMGIQPADLAVQIDKIYRVNSWVARQRQLPRDVVIYFTTRKIRNEILQASYKNRFKIAGKEVLILKEIPPKMLKGRKEFAFLVDELKNRQMQFRWDVPAGIVLNHAGERYRLNTVWKARDFYMNVLKAGQPPSSPGGQRKKEMEELRKREEQEKQAQAQAIDTTTAEDLFMLLDPNQMLAPLEKREEAKEQRQTRAATKRKEEEIKMQQLQRQEAAKTEAVGGARPKGKIQGDLQSMLQMLQGAKDGK